MDNSESRKGFLRGLAAVAAGTMIVGWFFWKKKKTSETVTMILPDGKLVQLNKDAVEKAKKGKRASNEEVIAWMEPKRINKELP